MKGINTHRIAQKITLLSPSPPAGEGGGEGETDHGHPHLNPPPLKGEEIKSNSAFEDFAGMTLG
jgi:hypothetical protein